MAHICGSSGGCACVGKDKDGSDDEFSVITDAVTFASNEAREAEEDKAEAEEDKAEAEEDKEEDETDGCDDDTDDIVEQKRRECT